MLPKARAAAWTVSASASCNSGASGIHALGIAPRAETADHAQPRPALDLAQGFAQGIVHRRIADGFQGVAGHVRELFVAQQRGQRGHRFLRADAGQLTASGRLFLPGRIGAKHGN